MPKETIDMRRFGGMVQSGDARDVPQGSAAYCENVHLAKNGTRLEGLPGPRTGLDQDVVWAGVVSVEGEGVVFSYRDAGPVNVRDNFSRGTDYDISSPVAITSTLVSRGVPVSVTSKAARLAAPAGNWTYRPSRVGRDRLGNWAGEEARLARETGYIDATNIANGTLGSGDGFFADATYRWYAAYIYDGFQEGPLWPLGEFGYLASDYEDVDVTVIRNDNSSINPVNSDRITGVALYRRKFQFTASGTVASEAIHLKTIAWDDAGWSSNEYTYNDDGGDTGQTYAGRTGIPPTLDHMNVEYRLTTTLDGYHFVGHCRVMDVDMASPPRDDVPDAEQMIFRSKPYRPDMFDWSTDFVRLPVTPTALVAWQGRLFAFAPSRTFVINPLTLSMEEELVGVGTDHHAGALATKAGLFVAGRDGIWWNRGNGFEALHEPIWDIEGHEEVSWSSIDTVTYPPLIAYDARYDYVGCVGAVEDGGTYDVFMWVLHLPTGSWTRQPLLSEVAAGLAWNVSHLSTGEVLLHAGGDTMALFDGAPDLFVWESAQIDAAGYRQVIYEGRFQGESLASVDLDYRYDASSSWTAAAHSADATGGRVATLNPVSSAPWEQCRAVQVRLTSGAPTDIVDALAITRRPLRTL